MNWPPAARTSGTAGPARRHAPPRAPRPRHPLWSAAVPLKERDRHRCGATADQGGAGHGSIDGGHTTEFQVLLGAAARIVPSRIRGTGRRSGGSSTAAAPATRLRGRRLGGDSTGRLGEEEYRRLVAGRIGSHHWRRTPCSRHPAQPTPRIRRRWDPDARRPVPGAGGDPLQRHARASRRGCRRWA